MLVWILRDNRFIFWGKKSTCGVCQWKHHFRLLALIWKLSNVYFTVSYFIFCTNKWFVTQWKPLTCFLKWILRKCLKRTVSANSFYCKVLCGVINADRDRALWPYYLWHSGLCNLYRSFSKKFAYCDKVHYFL